MPTCRMLGILRYTGLAVYLILSEICQANYDRLVA